MRAIVCGVRRLAALLGLAIALVSLVAGAPPARALSPEITAHVASQISTVEDADLRIVEMRLRTRTRLADALIAYQNGDDLLAPLEETAFALGFQIEVDAAAGRAQGWFLREHQLFELSLDAQSVTVAGERYSIDPQRVRSDGRDLFVPLSLLSDWFALDASWDAQSQTINLNPAYLLIHEEQERRRRQGEAAGPRAPRLNVAALQPVQAPYRLIDWPHGTADLSTAFVSGPAARTDRRASMQLTGDFLKMTGELFVSSVSRGRTDARLRLSRTDAAGRLFSPVLADHGPTQVELGDIVTTPHPLLVTPGAGRGFSISRAPLRAGGRFDVTRIEGDAAPGWQVELYRDGQLLGGLTTPQSGRYIFEDVPLVFGQNRLRVELYGPAGERRTIERPVDISANFVPRGEVQYRLEVAELGRGVLTNRLNEAALDFNAAAVAGAGASPLGVGLGQAQTGFLGQAQLSMGLTSTLSGSAGLQVRTGGASGDAQTALVTLARRSAASIVTGDVALDHRGEGAARLGYASDVRGVSLTASLERRTPAFDDLALTSPSTSNTIQRASVRLDGRLGRDGAVRQTGWSMEASGLERADGGAVLAAQARVSGQIAGLSATNAVTWRRDSPGTVDGTAGQGLDAARETTNTALSTLSLSGAAASARLRAAVTTQIKPTFETRQAVAEVAQRRGDWNLRAAYAHDFASTTDSAVLGVSRDFNGVRLGLDMRHNFETEETAAVVSLGIAFDRHPGGQGVRYGRNARSNRGVAKVRVYEDVDLNGRYDQAQDRLIEHAGLITEPRARAVSSDELVILDDLVTDQLTGIAVDADDLQDPYLVPANEGVSFTARPGGAVLVDLPVVLSGEIELMLKDDDGTAREGVIVELRPCAFAQPAVRERSAFDGLVLFQFVKPGCYTVAVPGRPDQRVIVHPGDVVRPVADPVSERSTQAAAATHDSRHARRAGTS